MKKGLIITSNFPINNTTSDFLTQLFSNKIIQDKVKLFVLAPHIDKSLFEEDFNGIHVYRFPYFYPWKLQKFAYGGGIPYNLKNSFLAKLQAPLFSLCELICAISIIKKENISFINSHWLVPQGFVGAICSKMLGIPHIASMHSSEVTLLGKLPMKDRITEFILANSNYVVSASSHRAGELLSHASSGFAEKAKSKIHVIPLGVDISRFTYIENKESIRARYGLKSKFIVLFAGRLVEVKGCEYLIQGFRTVVDSFKDVQLVIIGDGPLEESLKKKVRDLGLEEYVVFKGFVENSYVHEYYLMADIVVIPSIVDSFGFQEGFPVVLIESLAAGKAIVSTKTKGIMEAIKDRYNGILVDQKNADQISDALLELLKDSYLREKISANALETGKKYDWGIIANEYLRLFEEVSLD
ncbi:glycosyltransferase [Methanosarcina sp. T3]|uniref:glycosyltransferase n=1 Tax=Methanosarcina sp. T3 TaxID=3439062 RepID=UPI003F8672B3